MNTAQWVTVYLMRDSAAPATVCSDSRAVYDSILKSYYANHDREECLVIALDGKNKINSINSVSTGSLSLSIVHPREVMKPLILSNAHSFIIAHNHPSGDPTPSPEDGELTKRIAEAGRIMGIRLLDHIVVGENRFYSFQDHGRIEP